MYCSLAGSHTLADERVSVAYCRPAILHCAIHDIASKYITLHYDPRYAELLRAAGASERVLRLLFAKINNAAAQKPMPHHALIPPDQRAASFDPRLMLPPTGESGSPPGSPGMDDDVALFMTQPGVA